MSMEVGGCQKLGEKYLACLCPFYCNFNTVPAPFKGAASIQKIFFGPMHYGALDQNSYMSLQSGVGIEHHSKMDLNK